MWTQFKTINRSIMLITCSAVHTVSKQGIRGVHCRRESRKLPDCALVYPGYQRTRQGLGSKESKLTKVELNYDTHAAKPSTLKSFPPSASFYTCCVFPSGGQERRRNDWFLRGGACGSDTGQGPLYALTIVAAVANIEMPCT